MAELILAIVSVGVAAPGIAVSLAQCGEYLEKLVERFTDAPNAIRELGMFGHDLFYGKMKLNLELSEWVLNSDDVDDAIKQLVEDILNQLKLTLIRTASVLDSFFDKKGEVRRAKFALFGQQKGSRALREMREWQAEFESVLDLVEKKRRLVPHELLLSSDKLRVIHGEDGPKYRQIENSNMYIADCEYKSGDTQEIQEIQCLVEQKVTAMDAEPVEAREVATIIASKLCTNSSSVGVLQCLGYREKPHAELVFRLPDAFSEVRTLESMMQCKTSAPKGGWPLEDRIKLCRNMCEAVLRVHTSGLVHKNIRASAVLLVQQDDFPIRNGMSSKHSHTLGIPFLADWYMLRRVTDLSCRRGGNDWKQDMYRHPRRQGRQPEERYHIGHDIYSLGVILTEILLWETFIQPSETPPLSQLFRETAASIDVVKEPDLQRLSKLTHPLVVQKVLTTVAQTELAPQVGSIISNFVLACLTCLEGGLFGITETEFKSAPTTVVLNFRELFTQTFTSASLGMS